MTKADCKCGRSFVEHRKDGDIALMSISHGSRHGVIWLQNNEVWIRRAVGSKGPHQRHVGTFRDFDAAKQALIKALARAKH